MAISLSTTEVLEAIQEDDWENSDEEFDDVNEQEDDAVVTQDPLDIAQCSTRTAIRHYSQEQEHENSDESAADFHSDSESISSASSGADGATSSSIATSSCLPSTTTTLPSVATTTVTSTSTTSTITTIPFNPPPFSHRIGPAKALDSTATPLEYFMLLFDDDCFQLVADQTNLYASQNPPGGRYKWYDTTVNEIKLFVGMIIAMGLHQVPQLEDYWSSDMLLGVPGIVSGMPIDRFKVLQKCLHINDNTKAKPRGDPDYDRLHKIRPLLNNVNEMCLNQYYPNRELSVDEAMVGFKGRSSLKQYMPQKPTKRGYKVWCICDSHNGYMCKFEVYAGASSSHSNDMGLGPSVVMRLCEPFFNKSHFIFYDNYFSTVELAKMLLVNNTYSCGTTRPNRKGFPSDLKNLTLKKRGEYKALVENSMVECIAWQDKKDCEVYKYHFFVYRTK